MLFAAILNGALSGGLVFVAFVCFILGIAYWWRRTDKQAESAAGLNNPNPAATPATPIQTLGMDLRSAAAALQADFKSKMQLLHAKMANERLASSDDPLVTIIALHDKARSELYARVPNAKDNPDVVAALTQSREAVLTITKLLLQFPACETTTV